MGKMKEMAIYGRLISEKGLVIGAGGNISCRDGDFLIIKVKGADMSSGSRDDYLRIAVQEAEKLENTSLSSETPMHIACYRVSPDVGAVIHVHSPYVIAAASKTSLLEGISYEFECILKRPVPVVEYHEPGSAELARAVSDRIKEGANAVLMRRHGAVSVGRDLEEAYLRILALERACIVFLNS